MKMLQQFSNPYIKLVQTTGFDIDRHNNILVATEVLVFYFTSTEVNTIAEANTTTMMTIIINNFKN